MVWSLLFICCILTHSHELLGLLVYSDHFKTRMIQEQTYDLFDLILMTPQGLQGGPQWITTFAFLFCFLPEESTVDLVFPLGLQPRPLAGDVIWKPYIVRRWATYQQLATVCFVGWCMGILTKAEGKFDFFIFWPFKWKKNPTNLPSDTDGNHLKQHQNKKHFLF